MTINGHVIEVPLELMDRLDRAIKFYASYENYLPPRISGVVEGCERAGQPPISLDHGKEALAVLPELVALYGTQRPASDSLSHASAFDRLFAKGKLENRIVQAIRHCGINADVRVPDVVLGAMCHEVREILRGE